MTEAFGRGDHFATSLDGLEGFANDDVPNPYERYEEAYNGPNAMLDVDDYVNNAEDAEAAADSYDTYIGAELNFPDADGNVVYGRVKKRVQNNDGQAVGIVNRNPLLDTSKYEVEYFDGYVEEMTTNQIAENMLSQIDSEGNHFLLLKEISDHCKDASAINKVDGFLTSKSGNVHAKKTTRGWTLQVEWKDGSSEWVPLVDLKHSNPLELAEYAVSNQLQEEPAFKWWVKDVLRRRDRIISKVKARYWRKTHKFGIRIPKTVKEALEIDKATGTNFWELAIQKEMANVKIAFEKGAHTVEEMRDGKVLPGYQEIGYHMIFDIKMDVNFTRKARFVAGGHTTDPPASITYSSVVSRDSVRIAFMLAALNDLDVFAADIGNAYLNAPFVRRFGRKLGLSLAASKDASG